MIYSKIIIWWFVYLFNGIVISGETSFRNCRRVWGMSNSVNNIPMYSTGLYMCMEAPDGSIITLPDNSNPIDNIKNVIKNISKSTNFSNSTQFLSNSTTSNSFSQINKTFIKS